MARGLETARELTSRVEGAEARDAELAAKLAAVGGTIPVLTGQVKAVEKKVCANGGEFGHSDYCTALYCTPSSLWVGDHVWIPMSLLLLTHRSPNASPRLLSA